MRVRRANAEEVVDVRHRVLREGRPRESAIFPGDDAPTTRHWVAEDSGAIVAVATVIEAETPSPTGATVRWQLRGMAVLPELRGRDLGGQLLRAILAEVGAPMWCNARERAVPFYRRAGFVGHGGSFDVPPIGPHLKMFWTGQG